ncbi:hypothetical protein Tco_1062607 [Tanacetum coccineum]
MGLYHSRLTQNDLNDLIIKYKIPRDLHPRLSSKEFVISELLDDAIGFTSLSWVLLVLIRHYLRGVVSVFADRADSDLHWKSGFFFIDRRAISNVMVWRHPDAAINDPRPFAGSFNMASVHRLSAHVLKLRDMHEGVLVLSGLSRVWKSRICDPVLRGVDGNVMGIYDFLCLPEWTGAKAQEEPHLDVRPTLQKLPFYCTPPAAADAVIPEPASEDHAVGLLRMKLC